MFHNLFTGIFDSSTTTVISVPEFLLCVGVSLVIGVILAAAYAYKTRYNPGFVRTLAILPAVVCVVIMMVNGNVGSGCQKIKRKKKLISIRHKTAYIVVFSSI